MGKKDGLVSGIGNMHKEVSGGADLLHFNDKGLFDQLYKV